MIEADLGSRLKITAILAFSVLACAPASRDENLPRLEVVFGGCAAVLDSGENPTCILRRHESLDLWVTSLLGADLEIRSGERAWDPSSAATIAGGFRFQLEDLEAGELEVQAFRDGLEASWQLTLAAPSFQDLDEAQQRLPIGGPAAARRYLEERFDSAAPPLTAGVLMGFLAKVTDDPELARSRGEQAYELHRQAGNVAGQIDVLTFLHYLHFYRFEDYESAHETLFRRLPEPLLGDGDSAYLAAFYRGQWASQTGVARTALEQYAVAGRIADRLDRTRQRHLVDQRRAHHWRQLGRHGEAMTLFTRLIDEVDELPTPCEKAKLLNDAAWDRLMALEASVATDNPLPELERAAHLMTRCPPQDDDEWVNLRLNFALAHLHAGDVGSASRELEQARRAQNHPRKRLLKWQCDIEARIAFATGHPQAALELYETLQELADAGDWPAVGWRAAVGRAQILESLGENEAALTELARAETLLDVESARAPIDAGRETSVVAREWGTELYLDLLLRVGRRAEAFTVARRARSRFFRGLARDARSWSLSTIDASGWMPTVMRYNLLRVDFEKSLTADWALPIRERQAVAEERDATRRKLAGLLDEALGRLHADRAIDRGEPPSIQEGDLLLLYHPAPDGWLGFAATAETLDIHRIDTVDFHGLAQADLSSHLLEPFAEAISDARRVRILPYGALRTIDFHTLPFAGDVLVAAKPVVYALDLPPAPLTSESRALLVEDPTGSLPAAATEVAAIERALTRRDGSRRDRWDVDVFAGDVEDLRRLLATIDLLHFAGHADFSGHGLESGLIFDRDRAARLTVGDLLVHERLPAAVVISACETVRATATEAPVGLGVAHAFLLAGSQVVIGATRRVEDRLAHDLVRQLYAVWDGKPAGAAVALAAAQLELRRQRPDADWASFRVLER